MSLTGVIRNQCRALWRLVSSFACRLWWAVRCGRGGPQRIAELPQVIPAQERRPFVGEAPIVPAGPYATLPIPPPPQPQPPSADSWTSWDDNRFAVDAKIAEYRASLQKKTEKEPHKDKVAEPDLFSELQPEVKEAKKLVIQTDTRPSNTKPNLFAVEDVPTYSQSNQLVDLDLNDSAWDEGAAEVEAVLAADKRHTLEQKRRQRVLDHERRMADKRTK